LHLHTDPPPPHVTMARTARPKRATWPPQRLKRDRVTDHGHDLRRSGGRNVPEIAIEVIAGLDKVNRFRARTGRPEVN